MISVRLLSGLLALVSAVVVSVGAAVWLENTSDNAKIVVGLSVAGPPLVVAWFGPRFRIVPLLGVASAAYATWFCLVARDHAKIAAQDELGALELWPVAAAWVVAGVVTAVASFSAIKVARRRRARRAARRRRGDWTRS